MALPTISFVGTGNVAWHLAPALDNAGYSVREVFGRQKKNMLALTERLYQAEPKNTLDFSESNTSIFFLCVSDDSIQEVAQEIILPEDGLLIHCSGSQPLDILNYAATSRTAVFYPLQTFSKSKRISFNDVPIFIETEDKETERQLMEMGKSISTKVNVISSEHRKALHIAAVFASNFTNHMLSISKDLANKNNLDFELLKPLVAETISKSLAIGPENSQTGPAARHDMQVLDHHMEFLQDDLALAEVYKIISQHIINSYESETDTDS